jgi:endo-1,4-beta-xylanase
VLTLRQTCTLAVAFGLFGCGAASPDTVDDADAGGLEASGTGGTSTVTTGGTSSTGGTAAVGETGGVSNPTGGIGPTGGSGTGPLDTGGRTSTGGRAFGGRSSIGGTSAGGATDAGGAGTTDTGGTTTSGGRSAGGRSSRGGATAAGGNAETGGTEPTGGTSAGGTTGNGGTIDTGKKFVGNITSANGRADAGSLKFADYWDQVSPQNEGKWGSVSNASGQYNWGALDTLHTYATSNKIVFKEHCFLWGSQQPNYSITEADVKDWMKQFCTRYPDVALIDVVNEPPPHTKPKYEAAIGGGTDSTWAWIANAFKWAREACPNAILILNDYNNLEWDNDSKHFISIVSTIKQAGAPIDAIGCQAHDLDHSGVTASAVQTRLNNLIAALPNIYITEMDISTKDDAQQLSLYQQYFPMFWNNANVKGITIWGWIVGQTWSMAPDSGLITSSGSKRPAMTWLLQTIGR